MYMLEMRSVAKVFRTEQVETHALRSLELQVKEGEFVAVTGRPVPARPLSSTLPACWKPSPAVPTCWTGRM